MDFVYAKLSFIDNLEVNPYENCKENTFISAFRRHGFYCRRWLRTYRGGYQVKGVAEYVTDGPVVAAFKAAVEKMFNGAATAKGALIITSERVIVTTPGAQNGSEVK